MSRKYKLYMAYGSNLNLYQMAYRCPTAQVAGQAVLKDYELLFRGRKRGAVATIEPREGSSVPVLLWKIREADEAALDLYEGYPRLYEKQRLQVEMKGKKVSAFAYTMTTGHVLGIPSNAYVNVIREGYEAAGFDQKVLDDAIDRAFELAGQLERPEETGNLPEMSGWETLK